MSSHARTKDGLVNHQSIMPDHLSQHHVPRASVGKSLNTVPPDLLYPQNFRPYLTNAAPTSHAVDVGAFVPKIKLYQQQTGGGGGSGGVVGQGGSPSGSGGSVQMMQDDYNRGSRVPAVVKRSRPSLLLSSGHPRDQHDRLDKSDGMSVVSTMVTGIPHGSISGPRGIGSTSHPYILPPHPTPTMALSMRAITMVNNVGVGQGSVEPSSSKRPRLSVVPPLIRTALGAAGGSATSELAVDTNIANKKATTYSPQVEAISPTLPNTDEKCEEIRHSKEDLLSTINRIDREIANTESSLVNLKNKYKSMEEESKAEKPSEELDSLNETSNDSKHETLTQKIYNTNRKRAHLSHSTYDKYSVTNLDTLPLYREPSDVKSIGEINNKFVHFKSLLVQFLSKRRLADKAKVDQIKEQYDQCAQVWIKKMERRENTAKRKAKDAKMREVFEKTFPELKKAREEKEKIQRISVSSNRVTGYVRSEANVDEIVEGLQEQEMNDQKMRSLAAVVPVLSMDSHPPPKFHNENGFIPDPSVVHEETFRNNFFWAESEKQTFSEKYIQQPKKFGFIQDFIGSKSAEDCVLYYYMSKKIANYKQLVRRHNMTRRKRPRAAAAREDKEKEEAAQAAAAAQAAQLLAAAASAAEAAARPLEAVPSEAVKPEAEEKPEVKKEEITEDIKSSTEASKPTVQPETKEETPAEQPIPSNSVDETPTSVKKEKNENKNDAEPSTNASCGTATELNNSTTSDRKSPETSKVKSETDVTSDGVCKNNGPLSSNGDVEKIKVKTEDGLSPKVPTSGADQEPLRVAGSPRVASPAGGAAGTGHQSDNDSSATMSADEGHDDVPDTYRSSKEWHERRHAKEYADGRPHISKDFPEGSMPHGSITQGYPVKCEASLPPLPRLIESKGSQYRPEDEVKRDWSPSTTRSSADPYRDKAVSSRIKDMIQSSLEASAGQKQIPVPDGRMMPQKSADLPPQPMGRHHPSQLSPPLMASSRYSPHPSELARRSVEKPYTHSPHPRDYDPQARAMAAHRGTPGEHRRHMVGEDLSRPSSLDRKRDIDPGAYLSTLHCHGGPSPRQDLMDHIDSPLYGLAAVASEYGNLDSKTAKHVLRERTARGEYMDGSGSTRGDGLWNGSSSQLYAGGAVVSASGAMPSGGGSITHGTPMSRGDPTAMWSQKELNPSPSSHSQYSSIHRQLVDSKHNAGGRLVKDGYPPSIQQGSRPGMPKMENSHDVLSHDFQTAKQMQGGSVTGKDSLVHDLPPMKPGGMSLSEIQHQQMYVQHSLQQQQNILANLDNQQLREMQRNAQQGISKLYQEQETAARKHPLHLPPSQLHSPRSYDSGPLQSNLPGGARGAAPSPLSRSHRGGCGDEARNPGMDGRKTGTPSRGGRQSTDGMTEHQQLTAANLIEAIIAHQINKNDLEEDKVSRGSVTGGGPPGASGTLLQRLMHEEAEQGRAPPNHGDRNSWRGAGDAPMYSRAAYPSERRSPLVPPERMRSGEATDASMLLLRPEFSSQERGGAKGPGRSLEYGDAARLTPTASPKGGAGQREGGSRRLITLGEHIEAVIDQDITRGKSTPDNYSENWNTQTIKTMLLDDDRHPRSQSASRNPHDQKSAPRHYPDSKDMLRRPVESGHDMYSNSISRKSPSLDPSNRTRNASPHYPVGYQNQTRSDLDPRGPPLPPGPDGSYGYGSHRFHDRGMIPRNDSKPSGLRDISPPPMRQEMERGVPSRSGSERGGMSRGASPRVGEEPGDVVHSSSVYWKKHMKEPSERYLGGGDGRASVDLRRGITDISPPLCRTSPTPPVQGGVDSVQKHSREYPPMSDNRVNTERSKNMMSAEAGRHTPRDDRPLSTIAATHQTMSNLLSTRPPVRQPEPCGIGSSSNTGAFEVGVGSSGGLEFNSDRSSPADDEAVSPPPGPSTENQISKGPAPPGRLPRGSDSWSNSPISAMSDSLGEDFQRARDHEIRTKSPASCHSTTSVKSINPSGSNSEPPSRQTSQTFPGSEESGMDGEGSLTNWKKRKLAIIALETDVESRDGSEGKRRRVGECGEDVMDDRVERNAEKLKIRSPEDRKISNMDVCADPSSRDSIRAEYNQKEDGANSRPPQDIASNDLSYKLDTSYGESSVSRQSSRENKVYDESSNQDEMRSKVTGGVLEQALAIAGLSESSSWDSESKLSNTDTEDRHSKDWRNDDSSSKQEQSRTDNQTDDETARAIASIEGTMNYNSTDSHCTDNLHSDLSTQNSDKEVGFDSSTTNRESNKDRGTSEAENSAKESASSSETVTSSDSGYRKEADNILYYV